MTHLNQRSTHAASAAPKVGGETLNAPVCADRQSLNVLELDLLLARIASLAQSPLGAVRVRALRPCNEMKTVSRRQRRLAQLRELLEEDEYPSLGGLEDLSPLLSRLEVSGAFLLPPELVMVADFLSAVSRAAAFLDPSEDRMDELFRLRNRITPLNKLSRRIRSVVGPGGTIKSSASPALGRIRRELAQSRERLRSSLSDFVSRPEMAGIFSDQVVTQRADRFVVPVKTDFKGKLSGIIHDTSGSGATCFVEPLEAVEDNNQLALLRSREQEEERRVLAEISAEMAESRQALGENLTALAKLDCLLAQAAFCNRLFAAQPELSADAELDLMGARHPLLAWRALGGGSKVVPIKLRLGAGSPVLVISGANAGGKTAALKTAGLISLMAMCGLAVTADGGSRVPVFNQILAELGDEQDLDRELSTFTAHAGRLAFMAKQAGPGSLILVDELGAGTDPGEGAALGMALLDWFKDNGALVMCTTHFHGLKAYAASAAGVENVSVAFEKHSGQPTYQLTYGQPGYSDALAVSRGLGFPAEIISRAEKEVDAGESRTVALMQEAERARQKARDFERRAQADRLAAKEKLRQAQEEFKKARLKKAQALDEGKRRVREVARRLEDKLDGLWQKAQDAKKQNGQQAPRPGQLRQELYQARRQAVDQVYQAVKPMSRKPAKPAAGVMNLKAGDPVRLLQLNQRGVLMEDPAPGVDTVAVGVGAGGVRVHLPLTEMEPLPKEAKIAKEKPRPVSVLADAGDGLDLKLVGLRVEDALPLVDKALDQAVLAGRNSMRIVHGVGTGRLRQAVRDFLNHHPHVVAARAPEGRGAAGVTVAELRA